MGLAILTIVALKEAQSKVHICTDLTMAFKDSHLVFGNSEEDNVCS